MLLLFSFLFLSFTCISEQRYDEETDCSLLPGVKCTPFKSAFSKELAKSSDLLSQFEVTLTPEQATDAFFDDTVKFYTKLGASDPASVAVKLVQAARNKFNGITPNAFAAMCATAVEGFLNKLRILTPENASHLAQTYVKLLNTARVQPGRDGSSRSNLFSLYDATTNFCFAVTSMTSKKADILARIVIRNYKSLPVQI